MNIYESGEMYLETIYILNKKLGYVRSIDIANYLKYSKPSVSRAIRNLKANEFISVDANGEITLLEKGEKIAKKMYERHTMLTEFLKTIGVSAVVAENDACKMEHILSDETFEAICSHVSKSK